MKKIITLLLLVLCLNIDAQYSKIFDFLGQNGQNPTHGLISDGTYLYGMTFAGGTNGSGVLFKVKLDGSGYAKLIDFVGTSNGGGPIGVLVSDGTYLYGATQNGGANNKGLIFKIKTDGTGYTILHNFLGLPADGQFPLGSLIYDGTYLYGTAGGGTNNCACGIIFKIKPDGSNYTTIYNFNNPNGNYPTSPLTFDGTFLYGSTIWGGTTGNGTLFKIKPDGTGEIDLYNFTPSPNAFAVGGPLFSDGTFLYGGSSGGTNSAGAIFKIQPNGTNLAFLHNFNDSVDGGQPNPNLISDGTFLYGTTQHGGTHNAGTLFKIKPDGSNYTVLYNFSSAPAGSVILDGNYLYGEMGGGQVGDGAIYKYNINCTAVTNTQSPVLCPGQHLTVGYHTYSTNGQYTDLFTNGTVTGCDSTVITNLTVLQQNTYTWYPTMCQGQNLSVGSHTYSTSGTYFDVLTSYQGCDSVVTTHLTILNSTSTSSNTLNICSSKAPVIVGPQTYTSSGTYTYTFHGSSCDSTVITNLTVSQSPTTAINGFATICIGSNDSTTLTANGGGTYLWSTGSTNSSIKISPSSTTNYSVLTTVGPCSDSSIITVYVNQPPAAGFNYGFSSCCNTAGFWDTTRIASGDPIVAWNWSFPRGYPTSSISQFPTNVYMAFGYDTVCLVVTSLHGCKDSTCSIVYENIQSINQIKNESYISVYPNPATTSIIVSGNQLNKLSSIQVTNMLGESLIQAVLLQNKATIDISNLQPGVYFIKTNSAIQKFIKQ